MDLIDRVINPDSFSLNSSISASFAKNELFERKKHHKAFAILRYFYEKSQQKEIYENYRFFFNSLSDNLLRIKQNLAGLFCLSLYFDKHKDKMLKLLFEKMSRKKSINKINFLQKKTKNIGKEKEEEKPDEMNKIIKNMASIAKLYKDHGHTEKIFKYITYQEYLLLKRFQNAGRALFHFANKRKKEAFKRIVLYYNLIMEKNLQKKVKFFNVTKILIKIFYEFKIKNN